MTDRSRGAATAGAPHPRASGGLVASAETIAACAGMTAKGMCRAGMKETRDRPEQGRRLAGPASPPRRRGSRRAVTRRFPPARE